MTVDSFDAVFYAVAFVVPGFICSAVISALVPRRARATDLRLLEFLTLSCLNYGLWCWALFLIFRADFMNRHPVFTAVGLVAIIMVSPIGLGLAFGTASQRNWVGRFLGRFGFRTLNPIPTAWDYQFGRAKPYWVMVRLKDGSTVYGLWGPRSFASDEPDNRDLYIEAVFRPTEHGEWAPVEDSGGAWVTGEQIAVIEFRKLTEVDYGE